MVLLVSFEHEFADFVLRRRVDDRPQERERTALAVHRVLPGGERDVSMVHRVSVPFDVPVRDAPLPDRETDELQPFERAVGEVEFRVGELAGREGRIRS